MSTKKLSRRMFLSSAAVCLPLPFLPSLARSEDTAARRRFVAWFTPNGLRPEFFLPSREGRSYDLPSSLQPLGDHGVQDHVSIITGLSRSETASGGMGAHGALPPTFLTCQRPAPDVARAGGPSVDVLLGPQLQCPGDRFESLRLGLGVAESAAGHRPFSYTYTKTVSYSPEPLLPQENIRAVFDSFMLGSDPVATGREAELRAISDRSVLDFAVGRLGRLRSRVSNEDWMRLEQYTDELRRLERGIDTMPTTPEMPAACSAEPPGEVASYAQQMDAWVDLQALALTCGITNTITFMTGPAGSLRSYAEFGAPDDYHNDYSHGNSDFARSRLQIIERWYVDGFARLVERLNVMEPDGTTALHKTAAVFGNELADGWLHSWIDYPMLVAGGAGGAFTHVGEHQRQPNQRMARLMLAIMQGLGARETSFGGTSSPLVL